MSFTSVINTPNLPQVGDVSPVSQPLKIAISSDVVGSLISGMDMIDLLLVQCAQADTNAGGSPPLTNYRIIEHQIFYVSDALGVISTYAYGIAQDFNQNPTAIRDF